MSSLKFCRVVKIIKTQFHFYPAICEQGFILQCRSRSAYINVKFDLALHLNRSVITIGNETPTNANHAFFYVTQYTSPCLETFYIMFIYVYYNIPWIKNNLYIPNIVCNIVCTFL